MSVKDLQNQLNALQTEYHWFCATYPSSMDARKEVYEARIQELKDMIAAKMDEE